eukprot:6336363-Prymnesium_polylepis.1
MKRPQKISSPALALRRSVGVMGLGGYGHVPPLETLSSARERESRDGCGKGCGLQYGLWCAVRRYSDATRSCGASGT